MTATWWAQPFAPEGSPTAAGILRQLGRPGLDELTVLVREAAQNSWDARVGDRDVRFRIELRRLGDSAHLWRSALGDGPEKTSVENFGAATSGESWVLLVSDRGTVGLGGPTRASRRPAPGERNDFVQFLRNVGEPRDTDLGGGTYGFGKGIFYRVSSVRTILADSRISTADGIVHRLMGASLGRDFYTSDDRRHTGRHWWGVPGEGGVPDPLQGGEADEMARLLGLPPFEGSETGTTVAVLGVDLGLRDTEDDEAEEVQRTPYDAGIHLASSMLWHLWPKFIDPLDRTRLSMAFEVVVDGVSIAIPDPSEVPELSPFLESLREVRGGTAIDHRRTYPSKLHVGNFAVAVGVSASSGFAVVESASPFVGPPHHVARMRMAELVVDYLEGPPHPDPLFSYGGVYRASGEADQHFADAEPPTHDAWRHEGLSGESRSIVQKARDYVLRRLNEKFKVDPAAPVEAEVGLGMASRRLSGLVAGVHSTGPDPVGEHGGDSGTGSAGGGGAGKNSAAARLVEGPWIAPWGDGVAILGRVSVYRADEVRLIRARIDIVLDGGGRESSAPAGVLPPQVIGWAPVDRPAELKPGAELRSPENGEFLVVAELHDDVVTRLRLEIEEVDVG
jgi:hypothetical protein